MYRAIPKLVVLLAIGAVIAAIYAVSRRGPAPEPGVVYVNPGFTTTAPTAAPPPP